MAMISVNKKRMEEMTDRQLIEFLDFNKPVYELEGYEYLIATLASRLHSANDLLDSDGGLYEKLQEVKQLNKETQIALREARQQLNELMINKVQAY